MPRDLMATRDAFLAEQQQEHVSVAVTLLVGGAEVSCRATVGRSQFEAVDSVSQSMVLVETRDYLLDVSDLAVGAKSFLPDVGLRIRETINGKACVFEVQRPAPGMPHFRWIGEGRARVRAHTRQVEGE